MLAYPISLTPDDEYLLVASPDFPELVTFGETREEACKYAEMALEEALAGRIADSEEIPAPSSTDRADAVVQLSLLTTVKVLLYRALRAEGITRAELARRLGWHREQVDRLFRLDHASRLDQIEAALRALGRELDLTLRKAA